MENRFKTWWKEIGSGITPKKGEDMEEHAKRVAKAAMTAAMDEVTTFQVKVVPQPKDIELILRSFKFEKQIIDEFGFTGEYSLSTKDVLDVIIDLININEK